MPEEHKIFQMKHLPGTIRKQATQEATVIAVLLNSQVSPLNACALWPEDQAQATTSTGRKFSHRTFTARPVPELCSIRLDQDKKLN